MERLLDAHLEGIVTREEYLPRKEQLLHEKNKLQEQLGKVSLQGNLWLEPMRQFIETCIDVGSAAQKANAANIAMFLKTAGSNLLLEARRACCEWVLPYSHAKARMLFDNMSGRMPDTTKRRGSVGGTIGSPCESTDAFWWRRRDLNPRPKSHPKESLQAYSSF